MPEKIMNNKWVFVSHSNKDFDEVREIRNLLEEWRFRPLLFFLKCLDQDEEVSELIKREIECRTRFLLCESENTQNSNGWVQKEIAYIKALDRQYDTINLTESGERIFDSLRLFQQKSMIYISHDNTGTKLASELAKRLSKYDFDVVFEQQGDEKIIEKAIQTGVFIPIISENYEKSSFHDIICARKAQIEKNQRFGNFNQRTPSILSIFTYDAFSQNDRNTNTVEELWDEPCEVVFDYPVEEQCDVAMSFILKQLFSWGTIYAFARNFETDNDVRDISEASFLYRLFFESEAKYIKKRPAYAGEFAGFPGALARCYEFGCLISAPDLQKALSLYTDELNYKSRSCVEKQRDLILRILEDNIQRVESKIMVDDTQVNKDS